MTHIKYINILKDTILEDYNSDKRDEQLRPSQSLDNNLILQNHNIY